MNQLIPIESVNALELFSDEKTIQAMLDEIEKQATDFKPDPLTPAGRKEIASQAHKVSRSKVVIDSARKELTAEWAKKKKVVDSYGKLARDFCDNLRDKIRLPLTEYEEEQERLAQAAAQKAEMEACELEAYAENELFDREAKVLETELKLAAEQAERDRIEAEKIAEEKRAVKKAIQEIKERFEREAREAIEKAAREKEAAELRAKEQAEQAERARTEAAERAEREKKAAIELEQKRAKDEADRLERERLRLIEENQLEAQRRAADKENRCQVNNKILAALINGGVPEKAAATVIVLVASGNIPEMSIRY